MLLHLFRMVFSMKTVRKLSEECDCPDISSPDDMIIGMCLRRYQIPITHTPYMHQVSSFLSLALELQ